jgi:hypothetical protein
MDAIAIIQFVTDIFIFYIGIHISAYMDDDDEGVGDYNERHRKKIITWNGKSKKA